MSKLIGKTPGSNYRTSSRRSSYYSAGTRTRYMFILFFAIVGFSLFYASTIISGNKQRTLYSYPAGSSDYLEQRLPIGGSWKSVHKSFGLDGYPDNINIPPDYDGSDSMSTFNGLAAGRTTSSTYEDQSHELAAKHPHLSFFFQTKNTANTHLHLSNDHHAKAAAAVTPLHFAKGAHNRRSLSPAQVAASFRASASKEESALNRHSRYRVANRAKVALRYTRDREAARGRLMF